MIFKIIKNSCGLVFALCVLSSCSSNNDKQLQIRHSFLPLKANTFYFSMTWYVPPSVLFGNETESIIANMGLKTRRSSRPVLNIDNETRLELEEISISRLENELVKNDMCANGYKVQSTKWLERSIELGGTCLDVSQ